MLTTYDHMCEQIQILENAEANLKMEVVGLKQQLQAACHRISELEGR